MATKDLHTKVFKELALNMQVISSNTTTLGNIIDTENFESIEFDITSGLYTDGTYTPVIFEGNDPLLSDGAATDTNFVLGLYSDATITANNQVKRVGYVGHKRYIQLQIVSTLVTTGSTLVATATMSDYRYQPTPNN